MEMVVIVNDGPHNGKAGVLWSNTKLKFQMAKLFKYLLVFPLIAFLCVAARAQTPDVAQLRQQSFDIVWRTVKEKHFDPTFGGMDWDAVRVKYEPEVARTKNDDELYALLRRMLGELHLSHFGIIPPTAQLDPNPKPETAPTAEGDAGARLQVVDGQAIVAAVAPDSAAFKAGLRPGFVVTQIHEIKLADFLAQVDKRLAEQSLSAGMAQFYRNRLVNGGLQGAAGDKLKIAYTDAQDRPGAVEITLAPKTGELTPAVGFMPPQRLSFTTKRLDNGFGYIAFNIWLIPQMEKLRAAVREMKDTPGLIIDLRGNPGGIGGMAAGLGGMLTEKEFSLGMMRLRSGRVAFTAYPQEGAYTGPVAIIIDSGSASTSEIFAAGLQETGRAVIVGEQSPGAALPSTFVKLPTGALFQYAIADFQTPQGVLIEGRGVRPDIGVKPTRAALLQGVDAPLKAASEYLQKQGKQKQENKLP